MDGDEPQVGEPSDEEGIGIAGCFEPAQEALHFFTRAAGGAS
jgi:hypothetical protein